MDWQAFADGIKAWFALHSTIPEGDVQWKGEPEGWLGRPCGFLNVLAHASAGGTDEVRLIDQGAGEDAAIRLTGHRVITLSCQVRTRDQMPTGRACVLLERVRDALYLPSSQAVFQSVGVGLIDTVALIDLGRTFDKRAESAALLDIKFSAVLDSLPAETLGTIEQVRVGGTGGTGTGPITIPERLIP
jgi:hypothetical protein